MMKYSFLDIETLKERSNKADVYDRILNLE